MQWSELRHAVTKRLQRICWVYITTNFTLTSLGEITPCEPKVKCEFLRITTATASRVSEFRDKSRISEYRNKVLDREIGFFAESDGKAMGSIWATVNRDPQPAVVRRHIRLGTNEALIHDIVTAGRSKGLGIGPFMVANIAASLFNDYGVKQIVVDVNRRNEASLRMMRKVGLQQKEQALYISLLGKLVLQKNLWRAQPYVS
jgi:hypothetical protein